MQAGTARQAQASPWPCLSAGAGTDGVRLAVCVSANARRTGVDGLHGGALRVRLAAPPVDGKANELLLAWLAGELDVARRSVRLLRGACARHKTIAIDADPERVGRWLASRLGVGGGVR